MRHLLLLVPLTACTAGSGDSGDSDTDGGALPEPVCTDPEPVTCVDDMVLDLGLQDDLVTDGLVETTASGSDFVTTVDADAGGLAAAPDNPWVYIRFDSDGAHRVDIDDETALESMDWDLAAKRFVLRLNGGSSGPSCVGAAAFLESSYEDLTDVPDGLTYVQDDFYTDDCTLINDSSGLEGSPQTALSPYWEYPGCVATTGYPFLIQRADGTIVKFVVDAYYGAGQETCNESGSMGTDSAHFTFRWTWMD